MNVYVYRAALLCEKHGEETREQLRIGGPKDWSDESSYDSDEFPKGPYPDGGGEADAPQHCDACGLFLENPLTSEGRNYVKEALREHHQNNRGNKKVLQEWASFYEIPLTYPSHYHSGAGLCGYLYQDGPNFHETYEEAVESLVGTYELGKKRGRILKRDGYLDLNLRRDGNEYCEVTECQETDCWEEQD